MVGWRKLTNTCVLGHFQHSFTDGLVQNARSRSILGVRSSNLAQIEDENKGYHLRKHFCFEICPPWGSIFRTKVRLSAEIVSRR